MAAPDQRDIEDVAYPAPLLLLLGLFMMLEPSRDAFDACCERSGGRTLLDNCLRFLGYPPDKVKELPHSVTIDRYLRDLDPTFLRDLIIDLFRHLIRSKALHAAKLFKTFRFTIDATHTVRRHQRHCPTCLTCTHKNGTTDYFHVVVSVLLVTPSGLCIPVLSKAADNPADGNYDKQNCEINTAKLIIPELKKLFPQLDVTLIGDALYACEPIIDLCEKNRWSYILSFKDGSLPTLWKAAEKQRQENPGQSNKIITAQGDRYEYSWACNLKHKDKDVHAVWLKRTIIDKNGEPQTTLFAYITDWRPDAGNIRQIIDSGGRLRQHHENCYNDLKNRGFHLTHDYGSRGHASSNYLALMQITHMIMALGMKSDLIRKLPGLPANALPMASPMDFAFKTFSNFVDSVREGLRHTALGAGVLLAGFAATCHAKLKVDSA
jgi:hypothetical protein